jgi:hypothetical protein
MRKLYEYVNGGPGIPKQINCGKGTIELIRKLFREAEADSDLMRGLPPKPRDTLPLYGIPIVWDEKLDGKMVLHVEYTDGTSETVVLENLA